MSQADSVVPELSSNPKAPLTPVEDAGSWALPFKFKGGELKEEGRRKTP